MASKTDYERGLTDFEREVLEKGLPKNEQCGVRRGHCLVRHVGDECGFRADEYQR
jgi:hypothetical protein